MPPPRLSALLIAAVLVGLAAGQQPSAVLGEPIAQPPVFDLTDPLRTLGPPDQPFRPFAPLGPPPNPVGEGVGTKYGIGLLVGKYGMPGYGAMFAPTQAVPDQSADMGFFRQELSLFAPIHREGADTAAVGFGIRNTIFNTDAILPTSGRPFPDSLWDIQAGVAYAHQWDNGWTTGVVISAGSASDRPFQESNTLVASLAAYSVIPIVEQDAWIVGLSYAPVSDFPYPLPILSYYMRRGDDLEVNVGVPFFIRWGFAENFAFEGLWVPIRTISARVLWQPVTLPDVRFYGAFEWANETYFLADRPENDLRFYSYEKRVAVGMQFNLPYRLRLDVSGGYLFDRFYFQGRDFSQRDQDRVDVESGPFGAIQLRLQF